MEKEGVVHVYNRILLSHKRERNNAICSNMNEPRDGHTEWNMSDRKTNIIWSHLKNGKNRFI